MGDGNHHFYHVAGGDAVLFEAVMLRLGRLGCPDAFLHFYRYGRLFISVDFS